MVEPFWVTDETVTAIQHCQLVEHGGAEGVRDKGLLQSALLRPRNAYAYTNPKPDLAALAAAYAFGLAKNHPFLDGNKRVAAVVCETFIELNGYELSTSDDDWYDTVIGVAAGTLSEEELSVWIRGHLRPKL